MKATKTKSSIKRKLFCLLLSLSMLLCYMPQAAWADPTAGIEYWDWDSSSKKLVERSLSNTYISITTTNTPTTWNAGWYVVEGSVAITGRVTVTGNVNLLLQNGCNLTVNGGINVASGNSLTIYAQSSTGESIGTLKADAYDDTYESCAGIGGGNNESSGTITINGGKVTATGGSGGAGIGGGCNGNGTDITINGGEVTAAGNSGGAGIGGGKKGTGSNITISGTVTLKVQGGKAKENCEGAGAAIGNGGSKNNTPGEVITGAEVLPNTDGLTGNWSIKYYTPGDHTGQNEDLSQATPSKTFTILVTFSSDKGTLEHNKLPAESDKTISAPTAPTATGYTFGGWYTDTTYTTKFNFDTDTITAATTLYAKWKDVAAPVITGIEDNGSYYFGQRFEVADSSTFKVVVNGIELTVDNDGKYTLTTTGKNVIVARDTEGNETNLTVTVSRRYSSVQHPTVAETEHGTITLAANGRSATITPDAGYEIASVTVNGEDKGAVSELTGLKTGDKIAATFQKAKTTLDAETKAAVANLSTLKARSSRTESGKIKVVAKLSGTEKAKITEFKELGYTVKYRFYRSTKKSSGYKAMLTGTAGTYINTSGKNGTRYYYKVQIRIYDKDGNLVAKTALKDCKYATRVF